MIPEELGLGMLKGELSLILDVRLRVVVPENPAEKAMAVEVIDFRTSGSGEAWLVRVRFCNQTSQYQCELLVLHVPTVLPLIHSLFMKLGSHDTYSVEFLSRYQGTPDRNEHGKIDRKE